MKYEPVQKGLQGDVSIVGESDIRPDLTGVLTFFEHVSPCHYSNVQMTL